jgi:hypothetical protein
MSKVSSGQNEKRYSAVPRWALYVQRISGQGPSAIGRPDNKANGGVRAKTAGHAGCITGVLETECFEAFESVNEDA